MSQVWLITGSAGGLGRDIAEAALAAGHRVIASARDPHALAPLVQRYGEQQVRAVALDVTDADAAHAAVRTATDAFGRLDVVVNNAGYGHVAAFEEAAPDDFRAQIDTNFYGVVNVTRAALPVLRAQRSGHLFQISSVGGRIGTPGLAAYQAAKWAVGGFSEVIAREVAPFGVKVCVIEPGGMRTNWGTRARGSVTRPMADYEPSVGVLLDMLTQYVGNEASDPAKVAQVILRLAAHDAPPMHLLMGSDAVHYAGEGDAARAAEGARWRAVSESTDFAHAAPIPPFPAN
ncbi:oxidoreductase [Paraburkholderia caballeronis]|uniref:NADP-dependent 3-hydroxy acid dehydrogenase YdfG n=1 Tax=Paraburkholderia caballeronis TaxID=416943 RepID=A0A1H7SD77_9BURK|nr:oxidoreductase [Paraburkholderia caballeronis]PXW22993.1 NADP-dependent 3-hydroxy acid dehydrogenase YdfG [Paraburkholderia caballeronis]PXW97378.1 NADP-dependent 3-hydroxy acid dehydrogenase YdfG [Paraburkholderia caballeronis]RAJ93898.1 NADP-dependent 3-hydroxy acid dehydrogenase YdfG [Paraburkholderia caballeronis]TDV13836.1 NADP-dependent 3-hydroxy acid dehydrogenase YdfG [Paraburkholderia caballeronis]TDV15350.1 NADP-dependent 3-hydroxy acid dehydrogenase YdfG [Paraburkholderia caballe